MKDNTSPPSGTRDFLPGELAYRERVIQSIKDVFDRFGFLPLQTPAFERIEVLTGKYGEEADKLIFKILRRGAEAATGIPDLALRYDLTVPLARVVAEYRNDLPWPFKRYQIGPVWRADRPARGRFREFYQCDVDIVGSPGVLAEAETILVLAEALRVLGLGSTTFRVNSRPALFALLESLGVSESERLRVTVSLDKLDRLGPDGVLNDLRRVGLPESTVTDIAAALRADAESIKRDIESTSQGRRALEDVTRLQSLVQPFLQASNIVFSPFLARGLDYYTGLIFEIVTPGETLSIGSGGRYDGLVGTLDEKVPACGGSLGLERLIELLRPERPMAERAPDVLVTVWSESLREQALSAALMLRSEGVRTDIYLGSGDLRKQLATAAKRRIPYCVIIGPNEVASGTALLKEMSTGAQNSCLMADLGATWRLKIGSNIPPERGDLNDNPGFASDSKHSPDRSS